MRHCTYHASSTREPSPAATGWSPVLPVLTRVLRSKVRTSCSGHGHLACTPGACTMRTNWPDPYTIVYWR